MRNRYKLIFLTYFSFWYLLALIYSPNDSWSHKNRAQIYFYERPR